MSPFRSANGSPRVSVVGNGRLGTALVRALRDAGHPVTGPHGRGYDGESSDVVLLCVPDRAIAQAAAVVAPRDGLLVGHFSGATTLDPLEPHERFSVHPLMTITRDGADFTGAAAAVAGSSPAALQLAEDIARAVGMNPVQIDERDRAAYHGAACVASNYLITVLDLAERFAVTTGLRRDQLAPIVRATVENWLSAGGPRALTGPVQRGDTQTVTGHRDAMLERLPDDVEFLDDLVAATQRLADRKPPA